MTYRVARLRAFDRSLLKEDRAGRPRYLEQEPECWMCPAQGAQSTREHVFGKWVKKRLPKADLVFTPHRAGPFGLDYSDPRGPIPLDALQVGGVCAGCNNGWMSQLEVDAETILFGSDRDLGAGRAQRLAHWAVKTAVIVNISQPSPLIWTEADRHRVQAGPFARTAVSVLRVDGADANWAQGEMKTWSVEGNDTDASSLLYMAATVRIRLNDIVLVVARLPWQMSACSLSLPGHTIWDGRQAHAVSLDALPLASDWLEGLIHVDGPLSSSFWTRPALDFWQSPTIVTSISASNSGPAGHSALRVPAVGSGTSSQESRSTHADQ